MASGSLLSRGRQSFTSCSRTFASTTTWRVRRSAQLRLKLGATKPAAPAKAAVVNAEEGAGYIAAHPVAEEHSQGVSFQGAGQEERSRQIRN